jgi:hypothetical protein
MEVLLQEIGRRVDFQEVLIRRHLDVGALRRRICLISKWRHTSESVN